MATQRRWVVRFAYADPPYIGQAKRYSDRAEVNHRVLIGTLQREYPDGWALSCSSSSLRDLLPMCPPDVRVLAWVKPFARMLPNVHPIYAWEPVLLRGGRRRVGAEPIYAYDWQRAHRVEKGFTGAKPEAFSRWLFRCFNARPGDQLDDLFPGTGAVGGAWSRYLAELANDQDALYEQGVLA
jgi:hypothetical protein